LRGGGSPGHETFLVSESRRLPVARIGPPYPRLGLGNGRTFPLLPTPTSPSPARPSEERTLASGGVRAGDSGLVRGPFAAAFVAVSPSWTEILLIWHGRGGGSHGEAPVPERGIAHDVKGALLPPPILCRPVGRSPVRRLYRYPDSRIGIEMFALRPPSPLPERLQRRPIAGFPPPQVGELAGPSVKKNPGGGESRL